MSARQFFQVLGDTGALRSVWAPPAHPLERRGGASVIESTAFTRLAIPAAWVAAQWAGRSLDRGECSSWANDWASPRHEAGPLPGPLLAWRLSALPTPPPTALRGAEVVGVAAATLRATSLSGRAHSRRHRGCSTRPDAPPAGAHPLSAPSRSGVATLSAPAPPSNSCSPCPPPPSPSSIAPSLLSSLDQAHVTPDGLSTRSRHPARLRWPAPPPPPPPRLPQNGGWRHGTPTAATAAHGDDRGD